MSRLDSLCLDYLADAARRNRLRVLRTRDPAGPGRVTDGGRVMLNFSSNDYLGLSQHPAVVDRSREWAARFGAGAQASRLVCGSFSAHEQVERKLARAKGTEAALLLASGWQANAAVLPALLQLAAREPGTLQVYTDKLNHASLHHGCTAAGVRQVRFRHNDLDHLETLLQSRAGDPGRRFIVTESVFSMDGDRCDVARLADIARRHDAFVYLDEAHATGVLGPHGMGLAGLVPGGIDLAMGTFSKAAGAFGAYVAGSRALCDYLVNACGGVIYTTALPPAVLGAIDAALDLIPAMGAERARLATHGDTLRAALRAAGMQCGLSSTQIVPAMVGDERVALDMAADIAAQGMLLTAIRPPTVPHGTSRLRVALSAAHTEEDIHTLAQALAAAWARRAGTARETDTDDMH
ncbi:aminotransferase class I/II-fold pyridoxal phosphate-dependent enzyme [Pusillimonas sp. TS35]|nr:aminotransferase class I/II-fold pyridoxal phosphate-dependent enzyme [Pusillimonas sp. TS35]